MREFCKSCVLIFHTSPFVLLKSREQKGVYRRNPQTQEKLWVPEKLVPAFKFSPVFKKQVAGFDTSTATEAEAEEKKKE